MEDTDATIGRLRQLKVLGVKLSIDDFGTGYSSLSYLKRFPVDAVKIDQSFVSGLATSAVDFEIVAAVIRLASAIGITAVAEGVETPEHLAMLADLGCPLTQGNYLAPALPLDAFLAYCDERDTSWPVLPHISGKRGHPVRRSGDGAIAAAR
jgi:EAL domain-containing protein (putative c-di-GMP-specific phosphodiesterase class I)